MQLVAQLGLAFAAVASQRDLALLHTVTRRLIMQKARGHSASRTRRKDKRLLPLIVGTWFQVLFHSPPGVLFTFPSRYLCTIGQLVVFSLRRWSSRIPTGFLVSRGTWELNQESSFLSPTGLSPSMVLLSRGIRLEMNLSDSSVARQ